jgi:hypothetical protein
MKYSIALTATLAALTNGLPVADDPSKHTAKQPAGIKVIEMKPEFSPSYKRVRVTYGLFTLPAFNDTKMEMGGGAMAGMNMGGTAMPGMNMPGMNMRHKRQMDGAAGMEDEGGLYDASNKEAPAPCTDCTLKYAKAFLTYPDGSVANIDTGAWLHHLTLSLRGPTRSDLRCPGGTKRIPVGMERILAVHNDRNETYFGLNALDARGLYVAKEDVYDLELMLKNELNVPKEVQYHIEWEFAPGDKRKEGWGDVRGIWMDAAPCSAMMSDIDPPKGQKSFTLTGDDWVSSVDGQLLNTVGHMHDGGVAVNILQNKKSICDSKAGYDETPGYIPGAKALAAGAIKMSHISSYSPCNAIGEIKKGDKLALTASYDFQKWKPSLNKKGEDSDVMGVAMLFVDVKKY